MKIDNGNEYLLVEAKFKMDNMNGNYFYANWKQREIVNKGIIPV